ncbi:MAG: hypothetical protein K2Z81_04040 [Cyanobacteria bacterium]|nr:hypothetical protein [Cyanobacteriota bacterium]
MEFDSPRNGAKFHFFRNEGRACLSPVRNFNAKQGGSSDHEAASSGALVALAGRSPPQLPLRHWLDRW